MDGFLNDGNSRYGERNRGPFKFTGTATSTSVTIASSDNLLLVCVGSRYNGSPQSAPPDGFTYNGVALTLLSDQYTGGDIYNGSIWYLSNPTVGTANLVGSWTTNTSAWSVQRHGGADVGCRYLQYFWDCCHGGLRCQQ